MKSRKPVKRSRKCPRGIRKSDGKCKRKPGPKRSRKMKRSRRCKHKFRVGKKKFNNETIREAIELWNSGRNKYGPISEWDVSGVTDMAWLFNGNIYFNEDISKWDVSNVTDMAYMFSGAESFNQDLSKWNVSKVTDMANMFYYAESFNQDLSKWDVSKVTDMEGMFYETESFNGNIRDCDIRKVYSGKEEIEDMINRCKAERKRRIEKRMTKKQVVPKIFEGSHAELSNEITKFLFR
jgi:surface protein